MQKKDIVAIKVFPTGNMAMIKIEVSAKSINGVLLADNPRFDEAMKRSTVLAVGPDCKKVKQSDNCYYLIGTGQEVEHFYRAQLGDDASGQVYIVSEDNLPAIFKYVDNKDDALAEMDVVFGLPTEAYNEMQKSKADSFKMQQAGKKIIPAASMAKRQILDANR